MDASSVIHDDAPSWSSARQRVPGYYAIQLFFNLFMMMRHLGLQHVNVWLLHYPTLFQLIHDDAPYGHGYGKKDTQSKVSRSTFTTLFVMKTHSRIDVFTRSRSRLPQPMRQGSLWEIKTMIATLDCKHRNKLFCSRNAKRRRKQIIDEAKSSPTYCILIHARLHTVAILLHRSTGGLS